MNPYFEDDIRRIVSKESMIQFRKCKYSVNPKYIGCEVNLVVTGTEQHVTIYYQNEEIITHKITTEAFNYTKEDMSLILQSDVLKDQSEDEIEKYIQKCLHLYDEI